MKNYDDIEELVLDMFDIVDIHEPVTVIADKDLSVDIMQELLTYENVILDIASIDSYEYNKEYRTTLALSADDGYWHIIIDQAYNDFENKYFGIGGYILFHEDVNSRIIIDMQNNEYITMSGHDLFVIGEYDSFELDENDEDNEEEDTDNEETGVTEKDNLSNIPYTNRKMIYKINGREVNKETYEKASREIDKIYYDGIRDILDSFWRIF